MVRTVANTVAKLKWSAFTRTIQNESITSFESSMRGLQAAYLSKDSNTCKESYKICFEGSIDRSAAASKLVRDLETNIEVDKQSDKFDI